MHFFYQTNKKWVVEIRIRSMEYRNRVYAFWDHGDGHVRILVIDYKSGVTSKWWAFIEYACVKLVYNGNFFLKTLTSPLRYHKRE